MVLSCTYFLLDIRLGLYFVYGWHPNIFNLLDLEERKNKLMSFLRDGEIAIVSFAETPVSRPSKEGETALTPNEYYAWAIELALEKCNLQYSTIRNEGLGVTGSEYPHSEILSGEIAQDLGLSPRWLLRADQGGASALSLISQAAFALHAGAIDVAICAGADSPIGLGDNTPTVVSGAQQYVKNYEFPIGLGGPNNLFGLIANRHMKQYGTRQEQLGNIAVAQRSNAIRNPNAYLRKPFTLEEYMQSELISEPLKKLDCCIKVNGGLAVIMTRSDLAKELTDSPVYLRGFGGSFNYSFGDVSLPDITYSGFVDSTKFACNVAGVSSRDCSLYELYDDYTVMVLMELEDIGLCKKGEGGKFVEHSNFAPEGDVPMNTGGGLLSSGQIGLAGGFLPLVEAVRQLRGDASDRQVKDAKSALVTGGGGVAYGKSLGNCMTAILST